MKPRPGSVILPALAILLKISSASDFSTTHQTNSFSGPLVIRSKGILSRTPPPSPYVTVGPGAPLCKAAFVISSAIPFSQMQQIASKLGGCIGELLLLISDEISVGKEPLTWASLQLMLKTAPEPTLSKLPD